MSLFHFLSYCLISFQIEFIFRGMIRRQGDCPYQLPNKWRTMTASAERRQRAGLEDRKDREWWWPRFATRRERDGGRFRYQHSHKSMASIGDTSHCKGEGGGRTLSKCHLRKARGVEETRNERHLSRRERDTKDTDTETQVDKQPRILRSHN